MHLGAIVGSLGSGFACCKAGGWRHSFIGCFWVGTVREVLGYLPSETRPPPLETMETK